MNAEQRETTGIEREVLEYLNNLRSSGITNMFGATPYIQAEYPELDRKESTRLLTLWMENFNEEGDYELVKS